MMDKAPTHKRGASRQGTFGGSSMDPSSTDPTTTTKAVCVSVVAPINFSNTSTSTANSENYTDDESTVEEQQNEKISGVATTAVLKKTPKIYDAPQKAGDKIHPLLARNDILKPEENTAAPATNTNDKADGGDDDNDPDDATPIREDFADSTRSESQQITPEEAAAVTMGEDLSIEIHVEELLRVTFQTLLEEYHLLNIPTFSRVDDKKLYKVASIDAELNGEPTGFVRMEVMARPASLGVILARLERIGVGTNVGTVSIYKAELCRTASPYLCLPLKEDKSATDLSMPPAAPGDQIVATRGVETSDGGASDGEEQKDATAEDSEKIKTERMIQEARAEWKNAATRLRIEQVREQIGDSAALSFDFIALLTIASIIAGIGLISDNSVVLVASMLVSPIMGPVLGLTFGSVVGDWPLVRTSFVNETLALLGCLIVGVLLGLAVGFTDLAREEFPTNEMEIRGDPTGLLFGIAVAIPSGAGVCLSILGGNTSSLVGVAISASLLPPAVNAGICFMQAILLKLDAVTTVSQTNAGDFAVIGGISFVLTVVNIICIWGAGIFMFHIKEVAPTEDKGAFWDRDIKAARELNKKGKAGEKPPGINFGVLLRGLKSAISRKQGADAVPVQEVKLRPPTPVVPRYEPPSLNTAFAFKPHKRSSFNPDSPTSFFGNDASKVEEENDSIRYVGLEDMAGLLGFDKEDEEDDEVLVDPRAVASRYGHGFYL